MVAFRDLKAADITARIISNANNGSGAPGNSLQLSGNGEGLKLADSGRHIELYQFADSSTQTYDEFLIECRPLSGRRIAATRTASAGERPHAHRFPNRPAHVTSSKYLRLLNIPVDHASALRCANRVVPHHREFPDWQCSACSGQKPVCASLDGRRCAAASYEDQNNGRPSVRLLSTRHGGQSCLAQAPVALIGTCALVSKPPDARTAPHNRRAPTKN